MRQAVPDPVTAAVVTGRDTHRHAESCGVGQRLVEHELGLLGPTVRLRTKVTRGAGSRAAALAMVFKLVESAQARWRPAGGP